MSRRARKPDQHGNARAALLTAKWEDERYRVDGLDEAGFIAGHTELFNAQPLRVRLVGRYLMSQALLDVRCLGTITDLGGGHAFKVRAQ